MKSLKKLFGFVFVTILALVLVGCKEKKDTAKEAAEQELAEDLEQIYITGLEDALSDLSLPKYFKGNKSKKITWVSSSDVLVIEEFDASNDNYEMFYKGTVNLKDTAQNFTLTATLTYEYEDGKFVSGTKQLSGNTVADEWGSNSYETIAAAKTNEGKTKDVSKVKFSGTVTFTTDSGYIVSDNTGSMYVYGSTHGRSIGEVVTVRGVWSYYNNMPQVATGSSSQVNGTDTTITYQSIAEEKTISEIAAIKTQKVDATNTTKVFKTTVIAQNIANSTYNSYKFVDPQDSSKYVEVSKYNNSDTLTEVKGLINEESPKAYIVYVILYCSRSAESDGIWDVLYIPGTAVETTVELSDEQVANNTLTNVVNSIDVEYFDNKEIELKTNVNGVTMTYEVVEGATALEVKEGKLVVTCQEEEVTGKVKVTATYNGYTTNQEITIKVGVALKNWISVTEALVICNDLEDGKTTEDRYFVVATVSSIDNTTYCNLTVTDGTNSMTVYGLYTADGTKKYGTKDSTYTGTIPVKVGDVIYLNTKIQKYVKSGAVTPELVYAWLQETPHDGLQVTTPMTVADALTIASGLDGDKKETTTKEYYIYATVKEVTKEEYCNFKLTDDATNEILVYGLYTADGTKKYGTKADDAFTGDVPVKANGKALVLAKIQNYGGTYELVSAKLIKAEEPAVERNPQLTNPDSTKVYTVAEILKVMADYVSGDTSTDVFTVTGKVVSSSYNSSYSSYTIELEGVDGVTFELYSVNMDSSITDDFSAENALKDYTVVCTGYIKLFKGVYEMPYLGASSSPSGSAYTPTVTSVTK